MAVSRGRLATLELGTDGTTYNPIGKIVDATLSVDSADITVTTHDSGQWEEFLQGRGKATIEAKVRYDEADAQQAQAITGFYNQTVFYWRFRPRGTLSGAKQYVAQGYLKSAPIMTPNDDVVDLTFNIQLTGAITPSSQT